MAGLFYFYAMKKIAVFTSGGDAPGMNAAIRAVVRTALYHKIEIAGILRGYDGMIAGDLIKMNSQSVANIVQRGGTILKTARSKEFTTPEGRKKAYGQLQAADVEGLICIGGNGSFTGAEIFHREFGIPSIGLPGTIDNDLYGTDYTIGFDTATNTALDAIDRIRDTADSHNRTFFVEVMGRDAGFIALEVGIGGGAEAVLVPEIHNQTNWIQQIFDSKRRKKSFSIIVVAEGDEEGGAYKIAAQVKELYPETDPKVSILGHIQRGGSPSARDRVLASRMGVAAVEYLLAGETNKMVGSINDEMVLTLYKDAIEKTKPLNKHLLHLVDILNV